MPLSNKERQFLLMLWEFDLFFKGLNSSRRMLIKKGYVRKLPVKKVRAAGFSRRKGIVGLELTDAGVTLVEAWL